LFYFLLSVIFAVVNVQTQVLQSSCSITDLILIKVIMNQEYATLTDLFND
jgi:hypothetical protein